MCRSSAVRRWRHACWLSAGHQHSMCVAGNQRMVPELPGKPEVKWIQGLHGCATGHVHSLGPALWWSSSSALRETHSRKLMLWSVSCPVSCVPCGTWPSYKNCGPTANACLACQGLQCLCSGAEPKHRSAALLLAELSPQKGKLCTGLSGSFVWRSS